MNKFLQYINQVLESLDIHTSISSNFNSSKSSTNTRSKNNRLEEN